MNKKKITYNQYSIDYGFDFAEGYNRKLHGDSWMKLAEGHVTKDTMANLMRDWCEDNNVDFEALRQSRVGILSNPDTVDRGRVMALRKAGWNTFDIAIDCSCTEEVVKVILNER